MTHGCKNLGDFVQRQARLLGPRVAFSFEGRSSTFEEFERLTRLVANGLVSAAVRRGGRIAYLGKNTDYYFELLFGSARAGTIMVPVNWRLTADEIAFVLNDCGCELLFVCAPYADTIHSIRAQLPSVRQIIVVEPGGEVLQAPDYVGWRDAQSDGQPPAGPPGDDVVMQLYTSGTTGRPKGAMLRHSGFLSPAFVTSSESPAWDRWVPDDVALVAMPVFHIGGSGQGIKAFVNGARAVVGREFDATRVLDFIERDRISQLFLVPAAMQIVLRQPRALQVDYSCLRCMVYGGSPIPVDLLREAVKVFKCDFVQMYGMTEATGSVSALPPEDHDVNGTPRMRSAGKALRGVEIRIQDAQGHPLPANTLGEIAVRSVGVMSGYWNNAEASARVISAEGWFRTGDAGELDADGYLYIRDRVNDMIISGGENIYPAEVENAIHEHPDVLEVAVIGVPDAKWGEAVKAMVVCKPGRQVSESELIAHTRSRIAAYKAPKSVGFIGALPRNAAGKVLRRLLREPFWKETTR